jgi:sporadic carbohydrate cluster 2OG-Fe(II) oxygenase
MEWLQKFSKNGYAKINCLDNDALTSIRDFIAEQVVNCFNVSAKETDAETFLDQFHTYNVSDSEINSGKLKLIEKCNQKGDIGKLLYQAFSSHIDQLLGPDLLVQKNTNIILFPPHYQHYSEPHRDAPLNSPFELVFWVPLTKSYKSKSLYILNVENSKAAFKLLEEKASFKEFETFCRANGEYLEANFGEACIFWPGLAHGSDVNVEEGTRWTLNIRFKSVYSPSGDKDALQFFEILKLSPITHLGINLEKREVLI